MSFNIGNIGEYINGAIKTNLRIWRHVSLSRRGDAWPLFWRTSMNYLTEEDEGKSLDLGKFE